MCVMSSNLSYARVDSGQTWDLVGVLTVGILSHFEGRFGGRFDFFFSPRNGN